MSHLTSNQLDDTDTQTSDPLPKILDEENRIFGSTITTTSVDVYDVAPTCTWTPETTVHVGLLEDEGIVINQLMKGFKLQDEEQTMKKLRD